MTENPERNNYFQEVMKLAKEVPKGGLKIVTVAHDDWCAIYKGGYCNCKPEISMKDADI